MQDNSTAPNNTLELHVSISCWHIPETVDVEYTAVDLFSDSQILRVEGSNGEQIDMTNKPAVQSVSELPSIRRPIPEQFSRVSCQP